MELLGDRGAADHLAPLEHVHAQARHREIGRAGEAVMAGADDDDVGFVHDSLEVHSEVRFARIGPPGIEVPIEIRRFALRIAPE